MAVHPVHLMTVEEFLKLPESPSGAFYELHHGQLIEASRPKLKHHLMQSRLRDLLRAAAPPNSFVEYGVAFRAVPEYDMRVADVAYLSPARWAQADPEDNLRGAPDLVIEILSPSNTAREMYEKEQLCLANGTQEFLVIDPDREFVRVINTHGPTVFYGRGQQIPLTLLGGGQLAVDSIFC